MDGKSPAGSEPGATCLPASVRALSIKCRSPRIKGPFSVPRVALAHLHFSGPFPHLPSLPIYCLEPNFLAPELLFTDFFPLL